MTLKLEVGKSYKREDGEKVIVVAEDSISNNFACSDGIDRGCLGLTIMHKKDLVAEWQDEQPDWSKAGPGSIATLRCGGKVEIVRYKPITNIDSEDYRHSISFHKEDDNKWYLENGNEFPESIGPFDIIHIQAVKVEESPVKPLANIKYSIQFPYAVNQEMIDTLTDILKTASTDLPTYQRVLEQLKGVK